MSRGAQDPLGLQPCAAARYSVSTEDVAFPDDTSCRRMEKEGFCYQSGSEKLDIRMLPIANIEAIGL